MKLLPIEALRALSAIYVFLHHTLYTFKLLEKNTFFWYLFNFGQEAVIVFFILSGYVITASQEKNNYTFKIYFLHRFTRIYSVLLVSYIVSLVCWMISQDDPFPNSKDFILNLIMLQDNAMFRPGIFVTPLFGNYPLWSLGFEWWFYMFFFLHFTILNIRNILIGESIKYVFVFSLIGMITFWYFPNQISTFIMYYIVWFSGAIIYADIQNTSHKYLIKYMLFFGIFIAFYVAIFTVGLEYTSSVIHPYLTLRHFIALMIFLLTYIIFVFLFKRALLCRPITMSMKLLSSFASISFAVYLLHYPIMKAVNTLQVSAIIKFFITAIVTLILSYFSERVFYPFFKKITMRIEKISYSDKMS